MGGLNWIAKSSRLRFNSVCKLWRSLIQSTLSTDLYTATNTKSSSSSKFGTFLFHISGPRGYFQRFHESTILMVSPGSESEFEESRSVSESSSGSGSGSGGWCWSTDTDGLCDKSIIAAKSDAWNTYFAHKESKSGKYDDYAEEKVFKVFSNQHKHQHEMVFKLDDLGIPSCYKFFEYPKYIVGSCNGLICIFDRQRLDVSLWNPATRQFRILPKLLTIQTLILPLDRHYLVAFGFDVKTKDYKVVVVIWSTPRESDGLFECGICVCRIQVYSLSTDSWRFLEDITSLPGTPINHHYQALYHSGIYHSVYLNGSCFFIANVYPKQPMFGRFIISFDFTKEIFTSMPFPDHDEKHELFLSSLGEKLALFSVYHQSPIFYYMGLMVEDYDIWVLNEHKRGCTGCVIKESWTKLHSFQTITEGECTVPIGISNDGEFALLELRGRYGLSKKIQLYNLVNKEVKKDFLYCSAMWSKAIAYEPSLVGVLMPPCKNQA